MHLCRIEQILIIQTAFIGDVVLATALVEKLHQYHPDTAIDFLVRKGNESLLKGHPLLRRVLVWDKKENKQKNLLGILRTIRKARYDEVINVQRFAATGFLTAFSGASQRVGFDKNPFSFFFTRRIKHLIGDGSRSLHETERNQELIRHLTDGTPAKPRLYPAATDEQAIAAYTHEPFITVSPASVWFTKQYPADQWISFLHSVPPPLTVYLLGAPGDKALCEEISTGSARKRITILAGRLSFLQSAALMAHARMNYVNDSAPMHFASAMNAPVCAVYCSTIPAFGFGPLSDQRFIVETKQSPDCRPCGLHGYRSCPKGHFDCARTISDQQLLDCLA